MSKTKLIITLSNDVAIVDALKAVAEAVVTALWQKKPITKSIHMLDYMNHRPMQVGVTIENVKGSVRDSVYSVELLEST